MNAKYLAQQLKFRSKDGVETVINGPLKFKDGEITLGDLINRVMNFLIPIAGVILFLIIIWGGYDFLMSGGEPDKIKSGKAKITSGLIGFGLLLFAYVAAKLVGFIFGLGSAGFL